ncbi:regulator of Vps4 activity in the MVB pathway-domain-containing protein [Cyathus striatus]|nr:regulator of Vps4 activity in the MVB pathway-domain-containing protein [Cyathus striatus]
MEHFKAQLRFAGQKLGQLQAKGDSESTITRKDIATLLRQSNVALARIKAQKLARQDAFGDLLGTVEMYIGVLLENTHDIQQSSTRSPVIVEAASSVIFAAPYIQVKEMDIVRNILIQYFGRDFGRSALENKDHHVSPKILRAALSSEPTAGHLDNILYIIAQEHGVAWAPELQRHKLVGPLSEILNPAVSQLDKQHLRKLCSRGIPDEPSWFRPRIWKLLLGSEDSEHQSTPTLIKKQRDTYYDLVETFLRPLLKLPNLNHTSPLMTSDQTLIHIHDHLSAVPAHLFELLSEEPDASYFDVLQGGETYSQALDTRWKYLHGRNSPNIFSSTIPEIRLEGEESVIRDDDASTFASSNIHRFGNCHALHCSALMRLLYIHASINPGHFSAYLPSLLIAMYSAIMQEVDPEELLHAEADTFWLFESLVGEISELDDEATQSTWLNRFSDRLSWADAELSEELNLVGLSPELPHYSIEWILSLLSRTLPIDAILPIWDCIFCRPARTRDLNSKLEFLLDVCTAMLICIRDPLLRLAKSSDTYGLWNENLTHIPRNKNLPRDNDAFLEGISTLRSYPIRYAGGVERVIQSALDLVERRGILQMKPSETTFGERIKLTMWKGFMNQVSSPEDSDQEENVSSSTESVPGDGNYTDTPATTSLTSQIATTMWKGITNQTSMEPPATPILSISPEPKDEEERKTEDVHVSTSIWGYADKLKDSDAVATLSKVSSNWRARGFIWGRLPATNASIASEQQVPKHEGAESPRSSVSNFGAKHNLDGHSSPLPTIFRSPRDTFIDSHVDSSVASTDIGHVSSGGENILARTKSLIYKSRSSKEGKAIPRPLMLNSTTLITSPHDLSNIRMHSNISSPEIQQWNDETRMKSSGFHKSSRSSASSLSPSDPSRYPVSMRRGWDSDTVNSSRIVPLNRRSISPMAPNFNARSSKTSSVASFDRGLFSPPLSAGSLSGSEIRASPSASFSPAAVHHVAPIDKPSPRDLHGLESLTHGKKGMRRKAAEPESLITSDSYSSANSEISPGQRPRVKRYPPRLANLTIRNASPKPRHVEQRTPSPSALTVDWPVADQESLMTPKATGFEQDSSGPISPRSRRVRKISTDSHNLSRKGSEDTADGRIRKVSTGGRVRRPSTEPRKGRESAAEEGDDEGYDDLLSAYESEESWCNH